MQFTITDEQARALAELLRDYGDGTDVMFTKNGIDGSIVVAFGLSTFEVSAGGTVDEV